MGLTTCPKCGGTFSEKATICPHCNSGVSKNNLIMCEDCKKEYDISMETCPNCGCPNTTVKQKKKKHKGVIIYIIVFALIVLSVLGIGISQKAKELKYYSNMETVSFIMLDGAAKAENAGNLIKSVWYIAIYEERNNETDQYEVANLIKQLKNPPKKYEEAYSVLKVYYDNYLKMTKIVISPTGSLTTFSEDFNIYDNNMVDSYEKMKLYLD